MHLVRLKRYSMVVPWDQAEVVAVNADLVRFVEPASHGDVSSRIVFGSDDDHVVVYGTVGDVAYALHDAINPRRPEDATYIGASAFKAEQERRVSQLPVPESSAQRITAEELAADAAVSS